MAHTWAASSSAKNLYSDFCCLCRGIFYWPKKKCLFSKTINYVSITHLFPCNYHWLTYFKWESPYTIITWGRVLQHVVCLTSPGEKYDIITAMTLPSMDHEYKNMEERRIRGRNTVLQKSYKKSFMFTHSLGLDKFKKG